MRFESKIVARRIHAAQICQRIADLGALEEARAADDAIRQPELDEAILDLAHLRRDAHQHGDLRQRVAVGLQRLDLLADGARLLTRIPGPGDGDLLAGLVLCMERLAETAFIEGDEMRGGGEDMPGGAVIALQPHHGGAGKIVLEAQDVVDFRPAPAIDRLVVIADTGQVLALLRDQPQPEILRDIGILILVHQHVAEAVLVELQNIRILAPQPQAFEQEIAEIGGVERLQALLVERIELARAPMREGAGLAGGHLVGPEPAILPRIDQPGELARRPAFLVDPLGLENLLEQAQLIVGGEDGEIGAQIDELGMPAQDLGADRVEGAEPGHALADLADQRGDALLHLPRGLVREGDREDLEGARLARGDQMRDPRGEHPRLSRPGTGQHQNRPLRRLDGATLLVVQPFQIGGTRGSRSAGARGNRAAGSRGGRGSVIIASHRGNHGPKRERRRVA